MKIRIRFSKHGAMKFIGHLDVMRFFQKAMRRANIAICYSEGYSPHQIMSFASPLGVGLESDGEYLDIEVSHTESSKDSVKALNEVMVEGIRVLSYRSLPDTSKNAMSIVAAADYRVAFRREECPLERTALEEAWDRFIREEQIVVLKKTKKSQQEKDIRPFLYESRVEKDGSLFLKLASGSVNNIKPELVMEEFFRRNAVELNPEELLITRLELYADMGPEGKRDLKSLEELGEEIE